jgi:parvulin-like peptidyl-prolyl isomerase
MDINLMQMQEGRRMPAYQNLPYEACPYGDDIRKLLYDTLKEGDISDPIVDGNSITIFQLKKRIHEKERTFEEAQPIIRRQLELAKRRHNQKLLLDDLVKRSFVEPPGLFK